MYWFVLPAEKNSSLTLLASAIEGGNAAVEKGFESHFKSSKIKGDSITLSMERAFLNDSGTYYCAEVLALEQSPDMVIKEGQSVNVECSKKKSSSTAMYWFMLPAEKNSSLTLLASAIEGGNAAVEKGFESHFKSSKIKGDSITLSMERAFLNDSGTYYCAEGEHSGETAGRSEHKLLPAHTGSAFHLLGAAQGRGQLAARRGPCSMDFHRFLVATLLPVGKWPSLPVEQLHWSCCCLLSCAVKCWQCPSPRLPEGGWAMNQVSFSTTYYSRKLCKAANLFFSCPILILHLRVLNFIPSQNRFSVAFENGLFGAF
ncbi:uncharacterized protein LOC117010747 isoform X4 [Catharus ustulatus]|uniref:uncharacterized protein LOC117010747 isoform X4 n=1 Tax=Catharus ustulatus TaxID=91951 RepID=UPI00140D5C7F|nr:uncharacterized protein LOC117010747 isoform X4 [Catharus ustulatus]